MDDVINQHKEDANRNELLIWACARGLMGDAKELVRTGAKTTTKDKRGLTPLHYAASHGHHEIADFLASHGVDVEAEDPQGRTPLHYAAAGGHLAMVQCLMDKAVWLDSYDSSDDTALHIAARQGHLAICQLLCNKQAQLNPHNKRGLTPLGEALIGGHVAVADLLLSRGADAQGPCARGFSLLHLVCGLGLHASASLLLGPKCKADPNEASNREGLTPLHAAAMAGSQECVQLLLNSGAVAATKSAGGLLPSALVPAQGLQPAAPSKSSKGPGPKPPGPQEGAKALMALQAAENKAGGKNFKGGKAAAAAAPAAPVAGSGLTSASGEAVEEESYEARFAKLPRDEQLRKVNTYVRMDDSSLPQLPQDAKQQVQELRQGTQLLDCIKAIAALRQDEEFQQDLVNPEVKAAMEEIKRTNDTSRFKDDSRVQNVMMKMNRLQTFLKMNGNPQIGLEDILTSDTGPKSVSETMKKVRSMETSVVHMRERAILLLSGKSPEAAQPPAREGARGTETKDGAKGSGGSGTKERPKKDAGQVSASKKTPSSEIEEILEPGPQQQAAINQRTLKATPTTWKGWFMLFAKEFIQQSAHSLVLLFVSLGFMWWMGMLPGQRQGISKLDPSEILEAAQAVKATLGGQMEGMDDA